MNQQPAQPGLFIGMDWDPPTQFDFARHDACSISSISTHGGGRLRPYGQIVRHSVRLTRFRSRQSPQRCGTSMTAVGQPGGTTGSN